jgi:hypothetical protein
MKTASRVCCTDLSARESKDLTNLRNPLPRCGGYGAAIEFDPFEGPA